ncbi:MAG: hypothetical protein HKM04_05615 [Legionellales bacterium]|nr:hypothetical protein [Legionellales bacterium]
MPFLRRNVVSTLINDYEHNASADALAEKLQPYFDDLLQDMTDAQKSALLQRLESISDVLDDSQTVAALALIWQCIHAVKVTGHISKLASLRIHGSWEQQLKSSPKTMEKKQAHTLLIDYRKHLYHEIRLCWPVHYKISTNPSGQIFVLTRQGLPVHEKKMAKSALVLKKKCEAINHSLILLQDKNVAFTPFKHYFNRHVRPVINQERSTTDNLFLQAFQRVLTQVVGFFIPAFKVKGLQISNSIGKMEDASVLARFDIA